MSDDATKTAAPRTKRVADPEIQVMADLDRLICSLPDDDSVARVLDWLANKHCPQVRAVQRFLARAATPEGRQAAVDAVNGIAGPTKPERPVAEGEVSRGHPPAGR